MPLKQAVASTARVKKSAGSRKTGSNAPVVRLHRQTTCALVARQCRAAPDKPIQTIRWASDVTRAATNLLQTPGANQTSASTAYYLAVNRRAPVPCLLPKPPPRGQPALILGCRLDEPEEQSDRRMAAPLNPAPPAGGGPTPRSREYETRLGGALESGTLRATQPTTCAEPGSWPQPRH